MILKIIVTIHYINLDLPLPLILKIIDFRWVSLSKTLFPYTMYMRGIIYLRDPAVPDLTLSWHTQPDTHSPLASPFHSTLPHQTETVLCPTPFTQIRPPARTQTICANSNYVFLVFHTSYFSNYVQTRPDILNINFYWYCHPTHIFPLPECELHFHSSEYIEYSMQLYTQPLPTHAKFNSIQYTW